MTSRTTGLKYVSALFELCREKGIVEDVREALVSFSRAAVEQRELQDFLLNPRIRGEDKKRAVLRVLEGAHPIAKDFASLLVDKGREGVLVFAGELFTELFRESRNIAVARLQSARPCGEEFKAELRGRLSRATGKEIELVEEDEEDLLGGVRIILGSKMIDASVRNRLDKMARALKGGTE